MPHTSGSVPVFREIGFRQETPWAESEGGGSTVQSVVDVMYMTTDGWMDGLILTVLDNCNANTCDLVSSTVVIE